MKSGSAADGELAPGDVIVEVNHAPIARAAELAPRVLGREGKGSRCSSA